MRFGMGQRCVGLGDRRRPAPWRSARACTSTPSDAAMMVKLSSEESGGIGLWRSLVAHLTGGQGVAGSNPVSPTKKSRKLKGFRDF